MVTTRPIEITLVREPSGTWAEFQNNVKIFDMKQVQERLVEENKDTPFSPEPIKLEFHSPNVHNVTLVDLPGYILAIKQDQDKELPKHIKKLVESYIEKPNNLIVVVVSASEDVALSLGIREARKVDKDENRSLGVLSKIDLRPAKDIIHTLENKDYPLPLGYIGVMCRTLDELNAGVTFPEHVDNEEEFIKKKKLRVHEGIRVGIPVLRKELSTHLLQRIANNFPSILEQLDGKIDKAKKDEDFLTTLTREKDLTKVAKELEKLVNAFHPMAASRLDFEKNLRTEIFRVVKENLSRIIHSHYPGLSAAVPEATLESDEAHKNPSIQGHSRTILSDIGARSNQPLSYDFFANFFVYGAGSPEKLDDKVLSQLDRAVFVNGLNTPFYSHHLTTDYQTLKAEWQDTLVSIIDELVESTAGRDSVGQATRVMTIQSIIQFIDSFAISGNHSVQNAESAQLARFFFRYLLEQVSERTDQEGLTNVINSMIKREKRAICNYDEFTHAIREKLKLPIEGEGFWSLSPRTLYPVQIPAYQDVWTLAYFDILAKRISDDVFRILAVDLVNPLIFETIHYSLNLFKSGRVFKESAKQVKVIKELEHYRNVIAKAAEKYSQQENRD